MKAETLGTIGGTASGTLLVDTHDVEAMEVHLRVISGTGTVSIAFSPLDDDEVAVTTGVVVSKTGSATSVGTALVPGGGVPLGFGGKFVATATGTIGYMATVIGRL